MRRAILLTPKQELVGYGFWPSGERVGALEDLAGAELPARPEFSRGGRPLVRHCRHEYSDTQFDFSETRSCTLSDPPHPLLRGVGREIRMRRRAGARSTEVSVDV